MGCLQHHQMHLPPNLTNPCLSYKFLKLKPQNLFFSPFHFRVFSSASKNIEKTTEVIQKPPNGKPTRVNVDILKEDWLFSLSCHSPLEINGLGVNEVIENCNGGSKFVIGVDPDVSGALALLKFDDSGCTSAEVFDSPFVQVSVGKTRRRRLDARSIVQLVQGFDAPKGTTAYVEQSTPFPQDGKQGWWSGGFGYGLWIGVLVASGFSVVPVPSNVWKKEFELAGSRTSRGEALLIAAYGNGLNSKLDELNVAEKVVKL